MRNGTEVEKIRCVFWNDMVGIKAPWGVSGKRVGRLLGTDSGDRRCGRYSKKMRLHFFIWVL